MESGRRAYQGWVGPRIDHVIVLTLDRDFVCSKNILVVAASQRVGLVVVLCPGVVVNSAVPELIKMAGVKILIFKK